MVLAGLFLKALGDGEQFWAGREKARDGGSGGVGVPLRKALKGRQGQVAFWPVSASASAPVPGLTGWQSHVVHPGLFVA